MKKNIKKMRNSNPNLFKETYNQKKERLKREEDLLLENAVIRRKQRMLWKDATLIIEETEEGK